jgi:addiction module HigA family antidote
MTTNGMRPIHPGEILREEYLTPLNLTPHALSKALHVTPARINDIVNELGAVLRRGCIFLAEPTAGLRSEDG